MTRKFGLVFIPLVFLIPAAAGQEQNNGGGLSVQTDKIGYVAGESIVVSGTVASVIEGERLLFRLYSPLGVLARSDPVDVSPNGTYTYEFPTGGPIMTETGYYKIVVNYDRHEAETTFDFSAGISDTWWTINIDGNPYVVRYQVAGGRIHAISADLGSKSITVVINATREEGVLRLQFSRGIIQSQNATSGQDIPFIILIDGKVSNYTEAMQPATGTRELEIPFKQGQSEIDIIGTWMVPEFSAILVLILAATTSVILLLTRVMQRSALN